MQVHPFMVDGFYHRYCLPLFQVPRSFKSYIYMNKHSHTNILVCVSVFRSGNIAWCFSNSVNGFSINTINRHRTLPLCNPRIFTYSYLYVYSKIRISQRGLYRQKKETSMNWTNLQRTCTSRVLYFIQNDEEIIKKNEKTTNFLYCSCFFGTLIDFVKLILQRCIA